MQYLDFKPLRDQAFDADVDLGTVCRLLHERLGDFDLTFDFEKMPVLLHGGA